MKWRGIYRMMLENNIDNRRMIMKYTRNISPRIEKYYVVTSSSSIPSRVRQHLDESADSAESARELSAGSSFPRNRSFTVRWNLDEANYRAYRTRPFQQIALARGGKRVGAIAQGPVINDDSRAASTESPSKSRGARNAGWGRRKGGGERGRPAAAFRPRRIFSRYRYQIT